VEVSGKLHAPAALPPRKRPSHRLGRRLSGPQSRSWCGDRKKNVLAPAGSRSPVVQVVATHQNGMKEAHAFPPVPTNFALEYAVMNM